MRRFFCDCCGMEITSKEKQYGVVFYNKSEKTSKTVLHLCGTDIKKVRNMKFVPMKKVRVRKIPTFYNVIESHLGKDKALYMIPEWSLDQILSVNHKDPRNLFTEDGKRYYTAEYIISTIDGSIDKEYATENLMKYVQLLFNRQTDDEKAKYETKHHNNVGFNKPDAKFMSAMARESFNKGWSSLSDKQIEVVKDRFIKYAEQVANIMNENL